MKELFARTVFLLIDIATIFISILLAVKTRNLLDPFFPQSHTIPLATYLTFFPLYFVTVGSFLYSGIYTNRYDFWHETRLILKSLLFSLVIILAYLALTKTIQHYSRAVILFTFLFMAFLIPFFKRIAKRTLHSLGLWQKAAKIVGDDPFFRETIFSNPYLGYVEAEKTEPATIFLSSHDLGPLRLKEVIDEELRERKEVLFIPLLNDFDLTHSQIYELFDTRTNLVSLRNRLKSRVRRISKWLFDMALAILLLPVLLPILLWIAFLIKREEPGSPVLFVQKRLGKEAKVFRCYKFRTMVTEGEQILEEYLQHHPEEREYYERYHKYRNDPRVTKIGSWLRKTSLDELPQIFNVLKGEMSLVGPRPYLPNEKHKIGKHLPTIVSVRPGITGLWQVSGRSEVDFKERVEMDIWYIRNWNIWTDLVIIFKTVKTVLSRKGAM